MHLSLSIFEIILKTEKTYNIKSYLTDLEVKIREYIMTRLGDPTREIKLQTLNLLISIENFAESHFQLFVDNTNGPISLFAAIIIALNDPDMRIRSRAL